MYMSERIGNCKWEELDSVLVLQLKAVLPSANHVVFAGLMFSSAKQWVPTHSVVNADSFINTLGVYSLPNPLQGVRQIRNDKGVKHAVKESSAWPHWSLADIELH